MVSGKKISSTIKYGQRDKKYCFILKVLFLWNKYSNKINGRLTAIGFEKSAKIIVSFLAQSVLG